MPTASIAKGLEFRAVVVMACDDEVIPLQERMAAIGDEADLQDAIITFGASLDTANCAVFSPKRYLLNNVGAFCECLTATGVRKTPLPCFIEKIPCLLQFDSIFSCTWKLAVEVFATISDMQLKPYCFVCALG